MSTRKIRALTSLWGICGTMDMSKTFYAICPKRGWGGCFWDPHTHACYLIGAYYVTMHGYIRTTNQIPNIFLQVRIEWCKKIQDPHQSNNLLLLHFFVSWHVMQRLIATDYKHLNFFIQNTCIQRSDETFRNRSFLCGTGYLCIRWLRIKTGAHIFFTPICILLSSNN